MMQRLTRILGHPTSAPTRPRCLHTLRKRPQPLQSRIPCTHQRAASSFTTNAQRLFRQHPFQITLATAAILLGAGSLVYANYVYQNYIIKAFHKFPEPVAKKLRRALYFTNQDLQPQEAIKYYKQALQIAEEIGMDPFSDEIMGVKIQVAALMEKVQQEGKAAYVLEILRNDSLEWLRRFGDLPHNKVKRTRVLVKCVQISVKLGGLYGGGEIFDREAAEERLVWAVETVLKETQRRNSLNIPLDSEEEGPWLANNEIGAAMETLAHSYEDKDQHYLATPLFLQALSLYPSKDCHTVILMNNLASSLAQQSARAARAAQTYATSQNIDERPAGPTISRDSLIANAQTWAHKALDVAAAIKPPERTEECDVGCAVATHNLGEFAEMLGNVAVARERYQESVSLGRSIGFQEGVENSSERLRKLKG